MSGKDARETDRREHRFRACDGCGVKYSATVAGRECPVCGHEHVPELTTADLFKAAELVRKRFGIETRVDRDAMELEAAGSAGR